jgi:hypothetical protein
VRRRVLDKGNIYFGSRQRERGEWDVDFENGVLRESQR